MYKSNQLSKKVTFIKVSFLGIAKNKKKSYSKSQKGKKALQKGMIMKVRDHCKVIIKKYRILVPLGRIDLWVMKVF